MIAPGQFTTIYSMNLQNLTAAAHLRRGNDLRFENALLDAASPLPPPHRGGRCSRLILQ